MMRWAITQASRVAKWFRKAKARLAGWQPYWADRRIKAAYIEGEPVKLKARRLYIASTANGPSFGYLLCPCGCRETLHIRFLPNRRPRWDIKVEAGNVVSLTPSVWRQVGCRSHFVLERGRVRWC